MAGHVGGPSAPSGPDGGFCVRGRHQRDAVHAGGLVHCDVKTANMLVDTLADRGFLESMTDRRDRTLEIHEITFDARDPHALAEFWSAMLERAIRPGDMPQDDSVLVVPAPGQPGLLFLRVPEGKTAKNRIHFDLWPTSTKRDEQVKRAIGLGAVVLDDRRREDGTGWVVFADPEGNEFCIGRSAAERATDAR